MSKSGIIVTICRNLKTDDEDELGLDEEIRTVLESLGRQWTVTDWDFIDYDGWRPVGNMV